MPARAARVARAAVAREWAAMVRAAALEWAHLVARATGTLVGL